MIKGLGVDTVTMTIGEINVWSLLRVCPYSVETLVTISKALPVSTGNEK